MHLARTFGRPRTGPATLGETSDGSTASYANPSGRSFVFGAVVGAVAGAPAGAVLGALVAAVRSEPIGAGVAKGAGVGAVCLGLIAGGYWATHSFQ